MIFYDDNEFDSKKKFENKYGKLTSSKDIIRDVTIKSENNKGEKKNEEINKTMLKKEKDMIQVMKRRIRTRIK